MNDVNAPTKVDVLAVMRQRLLPKSVRTIEDEARHDEGVASITVVAELIEADREYDAAKAEQDDNAKFDENGMYVPRAVYVRMEAAIARRAAALARVGGAS